MTILLRKKQENFEVAFNFKKLLTADILKQCS